MHVDPAGTDALAVKGDIRQPWGTPGAAEAAANAGDTIIVSPGVYAAFTPSKAGVNWQVYPGAVNVNYTSFLSGANQNANLIYAGPASGGAAAPSFRALVAADISTPGDARFYKRPFVRKTAAFFASGGAVPASWGDSLSHEGSTLVNNAPSATEGTSRESQSVATNLSVFGQHGNNNYRVSRNAYYASMVKLPVITLVRFFAGFCDATTMGGFAVVDLPTANNYAMFRFSTGAGDTTLKCITCDGTATTVTDSGVVVDTNMHLLEVICNDGTPNVVFKIDGNVVATNTTHLPVSGTNLRYMDGGFTLENVSKSLRWEYVYLEADR